MVAGRVVSPEFIGRADVLSALLGAFQAAADGPRVALLIGEAGIGKSRILAEFAASLGARVRVVTGACAELSGEGLPYAPFVAVARRLIRELGAETVTRALPGPSALARWFPRLGDPAVEGGKHRLYEEVLTLVELAAEDRPLVVAVEDVHWADASTRELLAFLARNLSVPGVLLAATSRPGVGPLLSELARAAPTTELRLDRLTRHEVGRQLAAILGARPDPALVRRVHERSDGNPLFVEALAQAGERTPESLRELLLYGPRALAPRGRTVLRAAAVAGGPVAHPVLETVSGLAETELDEALRELIDASLLVQADGGYDFRHALIRQAVYEDLLAGERIRLHTAHAEALRESGTPAELAAHAYAAGDRPGALEAAWRAAVAAHDSYAYQQEARQLDRVLELWESVPDAAARIGADETGVRIRAAESRMLSGDYPGGVAHASAGLATVGDPERTALLLELRGRLGNRAHGGAMDDFARALELVPGATVTRGRLLGLMAMGSLHPDTAGSRALADEALRIGRETGDAVVLVRGLLVTGLLTAEHAMLAEAVALTEREGLDDLQVTAAMYEAMYWTEAGDGASTARVALDGLRLARRLGMGSSRGARLAGYAAEGLIAAGRWDEAGALLDEALEDEAPQRSREILLDLAGHLALLRGDVAAARDAADAADAIAAVLDEPGVRLFPRYRLRLLLAGPADADRILTEVLADPLLDRTFSSDARAVLVAGALTTGPARLAELAERATRLPLSGPLDTAWQATLDALTTVDEPERWTRAAETWRKLGRPYELALCLSRTEAAQITDRLPPKPDDFGLTPREHDVLALLATGLSNRQIAAALHISPSTAGVHVSNILAKLGVPTRTAAAAVAHGRGLVG
ncbi:ATP-binding protein [Phytomonospora endophytica]|uniref:DNA-binding CsgD family transcriptional regulator n=1 Tax=Phytomonospora endophytica TaxID=714109 RepID=A0A841FJW8_9ACTN|nr:AAA family ATPase [Phytomonospora endophytica]MBB6034128.1 DNA-binding CsgD family transcriptional regulator [Phytomonospora endophytica]